MVNPKASTIVIISAFFWILSRVAFCVFKILKTNLTNDPKFKTGKLNFYIDSAFNNENEVKAVFTYNNIGLNLLEDICLIFDINDLTFEMVTFK